MMNLTILLLLHLRAKSMSFLSHSGGLRSASRWTASEHNVVPFQTLHRCASELATVAVVFVDEVVVEKVIFVRPCSSLASRPSPDRSEAAAHHPPQHVLYSSMTHAFSLFSFSFPPLEWVWPGLPTTVCL